mgnify:CR=1 FL=1
MDAPVKVTMKIRRFFADTILSDAADRLAQPGNADKSPFSCDAIYSAVEARSPRPYSKSVMLNIFEFIYEELCDELHPLHPDEEEFDLDGNAIQTHRSYAIRLLWMSWMDTLLRDKEFKL